MWAVLIYTITSSPGPADVERHIPDRSSCMKRGDDLLKKYSDIVRFRCVDENNLSDRSPELSKTR